jgi:uncharacterized protein YjbI with pentapeptide repeats
MKEIRDKEFRDAGQWTHLFPRRQIANKKYESCFFDNCHNYLPKNPNNRLHLSNIDLTDCSNRGCSIYGAEIENVNVHNLRSYQKHLLFLWACVFNQVTLTGKIGSLKINWGIEPTPITEAQAKWEEANIRFYEDVDWALDISNARFSFGISLEAIPGYLIRRDPETQVLVTRESASSVDLDKLDWDGSSLKVALQWFLSNGVFDDVVLVAPIKTKYFEVDMKALNMLRKAGIAEK